MLITLKALLRTLVLPPGGLLILALLGLLLAGRRRKTGATLIAVGLCGLWLLATPIVADSLTRATERFPALDLTKPVNAQAIVILGGGGLRSNAVEYGGGPTPEMELLERLSYGAFVARKTSLPVLVSGTREEATAMSASLARDFSVNVRWVENQSRDTFENASFSARLLRPESVKRIILVTSSTHLWRATQEFQAAGLEVVPAPSGVYAPRETGAFRFVPSPSGLLRSHLALYELLGEPVREALAALHIRRQAAANQR
jgi:uncharacterized SAM-binding protein YcdF (DUF218 family)